MTAGRKMGTPRKATTTVPPPQRDPLLSVRISSESAPSRSFGRRDHAFKYERLFIPSLVVDYTILFLRQAGIIGEEEFLVWAGSLMGDDAFVSTLVRPRARTGYLHGEIEAPIVARLFNALDTRDLVPLAQVHSHPRGAGISNTDRERPIVAQRGFLSIIVPHFAFVPFEDFAEWRVYEYLEKRDWRTLADPEKGDRLVVDDSLIRID